MAVHAGSWFGLPDFGITEAIGKAVNKPTTYQGGSNLIGPTPKAPAAYNPPKPTPVQSVKGASTSAVSGGGGGGYNMPSTASYSNSASSNQGFQNIQQGQDNGNAQIEADYNNSIAMLNDAAGGLQGQAGTATSQIENDAAAARTSLGAEQATQEGGANANLATAEKQGTSAMQQARDVFRQTQQQNNAQLSALGISSSSVAEALAERLGVDVAKRIAGVTGSLDEVRQNTVKELGRIQNYYAEKKTQLDQNVTIQKQQIQQSLMAGLNQINAAKNQAASDKAAARSNLLSQVQNQIYSLTQQQQQFDQALQQWAAQKSAALTPIAQDPNYINKLMETANVFNKQFSNQGLSFAPEVNMNANGQMTGRIVSNKKPEDQIVNPFATQ